MNEVRGWKTIPIPLTEDMEVAFAETWYSKRRCIDDVDMADAWQAACDAAPDAPENPRTESLSRQVERLNSLLRSSGESRERLRLENEQMLSLLRDALKVGDLGFYNVAMDPSYRALVRHTVQRFEPRGVGQPSSVEDDVENLQAALNSERPGSEDIRSTLYETIARVESERDAARAALQALQEATPTVKLTVVHRGHEVDEPLVTLSPEFARQFDEMPAGTEVSLFAQAAPAPFRGEGLANLRFPTMLRQMWSGTEVQEWINSQGPVYVWPSLQRASFQTRVAPWLIECFGPLIAADTQERNHRFLEEALELVQACGTTADDAYALVGYVFGRQVGERTQEVGGVMVTLAALCQAQGLQMHQAGELELERISQPDTMARIREKQKNKPSMGPLPGSYPGRVP